MRIETYFFQYSVSEFITANRYWIEFVSDVFISYSRKNSNFARKLIDRLIFKGKDAWVDWEGIPLTAPNWWMEIKTGIEAADNFLFIISPDSMASIVCNMELDYAIELKKRIVPVVYVDTDHRDSFASIADYKPDEAMKERLTGKDPLIVARDNWQHISHINWVFFRDTDDFDSAFEKLISTVETDLSYVKAHTRYLTKAKEWFREKRRSDLLLFGGEIDRAEEWLEKAVQFESKKHEEVEVINPLPDDLHREYIAASRKADRTRRRLARSAIVSITILVLVLIAGIVLGSTIVSRTRQQVADSQSTLQVVEMQIEDGENTIYSLNLARQAEEVYPEDNILGLSLALEANRVPNPPFTAQRILANLAYQPAQRAIFNGHTDEVSSMAFAPDGQNVLSASYAEMILWSIDTGEVLQRYKGLEGEGWIYGISFAPDGQSALSATYDNVTKWKYGKDGVFERTEHGIPSDSSDDSIAFSPNGQTAISGTADSAIILWNVTSGELLHRFEGHSGPVTSVAFSPDGQMAISASEDTTLILWDVTNGKLLRRFEGHFGPVRSATFSPDGQMAISVSDDATIILWDVTNGKLLYRFEGHSGPIRSVAFSPNGRMAVSASEDTTLILWDVTNGDLLQRFEEHSSPVTSVSFSPDGQTVLSYACAAFGDRGISCIRNELIFWGVDNAILRQYDGELQQPNGLATAPDNRTSLSGLDDGTLILQDIASGDILRRFEGHSEQVLSAAYANDGQAILSGSCVSYDFPPHPRNERTLPPKVCTRGELFLWEIDNGMILRTFIGHSGDVSSVVFAPDGQTALSGSCAEHTDLSVCIRGELILWNVSTGEIIWHQEQHSGDVLSVAISPDGKTALSGSCAQYSVRDPSYCIRGELILWDVRSGELLWRLEGHSGSVNSIKYNSDGQTALSTASDGTLILWRIDSLDQLIRWTEENRIVRTFTCEERVVFDIQPSCEKGTPLATFTPIPTRTAFPTAATGSMWTPIATPTVID